MAEMKLYELEMLRSRIYHGEQELISTLTPEQFFALLSHDYDIGIVGQVNQLVQRNGSDAVILLDFQKSIHPFFLLLCQ